MALPPKHTTYKDSPGWAAILLCLAIGTSSCDKASSPPPQKTQTGQRLPAPATPSGRRTHWAVPIDKPGLPNLHKINDQLYRGAQPDDEGFAQLKAMGIKTVVNLRTRHSDREQCRQNDLDYVHITVQPWEGEDEEVVEFLKLAADSDRWPIFFHCRHGADRTGTMSAIYRLTVQGWSKDQAIEEMTKGGFGFHRIWQNLIKYIRELDIDDIKSQAGID